jgi:hypothetical protein
VVLGPDAVNLIRVLRAERDNIAQSLTANAIKRAVVKLGLGGSANLAGVRARLAPALAKIAPARAI